MFLQSHYLQSGPTLSDPHRLLFGIRPVQDRGYPIGLQRLIHAGGAESLRAIAAGLNDFGIPTARGNGICGGP